MLPMLGGKVEEREQCVGVLLQGCDGLWVLGPVLAGEPGDRVPRGAPPGTRPPPSPTPPRASGGLPRGRSRQAGIARPPRPAPPRRRRPQHGCRLLPPARQGAAAGQAGGYAAAVTGPTIHNFRSYLVLPAVWPPVSDSVSPRTAIVLTGILAVMRGCM